MTTAASHPIKIIQSLGDIAAGYDALLCDVWGVIHNGQTPYPGACEALIRFRNTRGPVLLISNAPRPSADIPAQLDAIGVPRQAYDEIVTSGDATRHLIETQMPGARVFHIGPDRDLPFFDGLDVTRGPLEAADIVVCTGLTDDTRETPSDYDDTLNALLARNLTMYCANPDQVVMRGDILIYCGGAIAKAYEDKGGPVIYAGKPHAPIYELAMAQLSKLRADNKPPAKALAVGDAYATDIAGAGSQGIDSLLVSAGIHVEEFGVDRGNPDPKKIAAVSERFGLWPSSVIARLVWP